MALTNEQILDRLARLTAPGVRERLLARGLARSLIWRDGALPPEAPPFARTLSYDLQSHAFQILQLALSLTGQFRFQQIVLDSFRIAAEELEAVVRRGDPETQDRGFLTVVTAAAYQLGRLGARSYVVLPPNLETLPLSVAERLLALLLRREFGPINDVVVNWAESAKAGAEKVAAHIQNISDFQVVHEEGETGDFSDALDEGIAWMLTDNYVRAIANLDISIRYNNPEIYEESKQKLSIGLSTAANARHVPLWWIYTLTQKIIDDLWETMVWNILPSLEDGAVAKEEWNRLRLNYIRSKLAKPRPELEMWPSQIDAARRSVNESASMVLALPTSAGKTKIAELCILRALSLGMRVFYITPLRALSAQLERVLATTFVPLGFSVSSLYGASGVSKIDIDIAQSDHIIVATPEKLDYVLRNEPDALDDVGLVVLDEGHMIGLRVREIRYETLVQRLLKREDAHLRRIVCLSAIFDSGESFDDFVSWISRGNAEAAIRSEWRPTRQRAAVCVWEHSFARLQFYVDDEQPFVPKYLIERKVKGRRTRKLPDNKNELVVALAERLIEEGHTVLVYCPQRRSVNTMANIFLDLVDRDAVKFPVGNADVLNRAIFIGSEWLGEKHLAVQCLKRGIAIHHGTLPRPFLSVIEQMINERNVRLVVASPTLAQGLDLACSALVFQSLHRRGEPIPSSEFTNVIGRVGRAFVDIEGVSVFPVFEANQRSSEYRINQFLSAWQQAHHRQLESGLVQLLATIIGILAQRLGVTPTDLSERIAAIDFDWQGAVSLPGDDEPDAELDQADIAKLVAQLDETLLTIIDPQTDVGQLAEILDQSLQDSYWRRRLARFDDPSNYVQQREVLLSRARWVWNKTDIQSRQGFATAGIGLATGSKLLDQLDVLAARLPEAEDAIVRSDIETVMAALTPVIKALSQIEPFKIELPEDWMLLLRQWLSGEHIWGNAQIASDENMQFISDGLVYRAVWGIEAIRSLAIAKGILDKSFVAGAITETMTFGCHETFGRWLLRHGLSSRRMAVEISEYFNTKFITEITSKEMLQLMIDAELVDELYRDSPDKLRIWDSFVRQDVTVNRKAWEESSRSEKIADNLEFDKATILRMIQKEGSIAKFFSPDLDHLFDVSMPSEDYFFGHVKVTAMPDGELKMERFGPS